MNAVSELDGLYTAAPILDYDEEPRAEDQRPENEELYGPGVAMLAPADFDAAILEALVSP